MTTMMVDNIPGQLLALLAPSHCHWCAGDPGAAPACASCAASLPHNRRACRACALPLPSATPLSVCAQCLEQAPAQDSTWTAFRYESPVAQAIVELKFRGRLAPAHVLGHLVADALARRAAPLPELLIPVPLHAQRLRQRGYNQALELGRPIARRLSLRLVPFAVRRTVATGEQTRLDAASRRRNVRGAFAVEAAVVRGRDVAVLDDVITTGATVAELACALRVAGAARIEAWAVARAV